MGGFNCGRGDCTRLVGRYDDYLACTGNCRSAFHIACVGISIEQFTEMKKSGAVKSWKCSECRFDTGGQQSYSLTRQVSDPVALPQDTNAKPEMTCGRCSNLLKYISDIFGQMESKLLAEMKSTKEELLREITSSLEGRVRELSGKMSQLSSVIGPSAEPLSVNTTYAQAACKRSSVVIKPKDDKQTNAATKRELLHNINPVTSNLNVSKVKHIKGGGVVVSCPTKEAADRLTREAADKLSQKYTIQEAKSINPRIRVVGMTEEHTEDLFLNYIRVQNPQVFDGTSELKVISYAPIKEKASGGTRRTSTAFQSVIQVDINVYNKALSAGHLFVGYDSCAVYDALEVLRCYKCSGFGHLSANCKSGVVCPRCSGGHAVKDCTSDVLKCINCSNASKITPDLNCDHAAWDRVCSVYQRKLQMFRADVLGLK